MRILVTGWDNPSGRAIVQALLIDGHHVRAFGGVNPPHLQAPVGRFSWFAGSVVTAGSIEPALSERQVLVHAAGLDEPGKDRKKHAIHIETGTLFARYGAEREQVDHFIHVTASKPSRTYSEAFARAEQSVQLTRGTIHRTVVRAGSAEEAAHGVRAALAAKALLGKQPGRETDAVTA